ncbi:uncharacterized protein METZ01_LOCUS405696, partial [marine metagenome]
IYHQGYLYQKSKLFNNAYNHYRTLQIYFPKNQLTQKAKEEMKKLAKVEQIKIEPLLLDEHERRIKELLYDVEYHQVVSEVSEILKTQNFLPANFYFYLAKAQKGLRKRNLSNAALRKFLKHYPDHRRTQEALFTIGRNLWNTGYYRDGLKYFEKSVDEGTDHTLINQALFFIGKMHEEKKRYPQANKYYTKLVKKLDGDYPERALWQLGWMNYTTENFQKAYDYFTESTVKYPSGLFAESSMFWSAKSAEKLKHKELAQKIFQTVNTAYPYTYYGIRAGE